MVLRIHREPKLKNQEKRLCFKARWAKRLIRTAAVFADGGTSLSRVATENEQHVGRTRTFHPRVQRQVTPEADLYLITY